MVVGMISCNSNQQLTWREWGNRAVQLQKAGNVDSAASWARAAFALYEKAESEPDTTHVAALERIADCLWRSRDYDSYFRVMWQCVECLEKGFGPNDLRVLRALCLLGGAYRRVTRFVEAVSALHQVRDSLEYSTEPDSSLLVEVLMDLAHSCREVGTYAEAESSLTRVFSILEKKSNPDVNDLWNFFHESAALRLEQGLYFAAESLLTRSLEFCDDSSKCEPGVLATNLNDLGLTYHKMGRYVEAESLYVKAMKLWEKAKNSAGIASAVNNLGSFYYKEGRYEEALQCHERALQFRREFLDPSHTEIAGSLDHLGVLYCDYGASSTEKRLSMRHSKFE